METVDKVTPFVGVWIETENYILTSPRFAVTPFVGVWIETVAHWVLPRNRLVSHPSWVCGLKLNCTGRAAGLT